MIHVIATITVVAGKRSELLEQFKLIIPEVLAEQGCVAYEPTFETPTGIEDMATPREDVLIMVERWETIENLQAHLAAPHMAKFRAAVGEIVESVDLCVTESAV